MTVMASPVALFTRPLCIASMRASSSVSSSSKRSSSGHQARARVRTLPNVSSYCAICSSTFVRSSGERERYSALFLISTMPNSSPISNTDTRERPSSARTARRAYRS